MALPDRKRLGDELHRLGEVAQARSDTLMRRSEAATTNTSDGLNFFRASLSQQKANVFNLAEWFIGPAKYAKRRKVVR